MGLEGVYIVQRTEETFGITISDEEAAHCVTPDQLFGLVNARVRSRRSGACATQHVFHAVRRGLRRALPPSAPPVKPGSSLRSMVTRSEWPRTWAIVRSHAGSRSWPDEVPWSGACSSGPRSTRDLVWFIAGHVALRSPPRRWSRQEVEAALRLIIFEETGSGPGFDRRTPFRQLGVM